MMSTLRACPSCQAEGLSAFYEVKSVPVHDVLLMPTRDIAIGCPRGDIILAFCQTCGLISNVAFDARLLEYSTGYEGTQSFSPTFSSFARRLATDLVERYDLHGKDILEIGCGMGEFLTLLCELGGNRGLGFDPAYVEGRVLSPAAEDITFIKDYYSEQYSHCRADLVVCKMTLEHIPDTAGFVSMVRRSIGEHLDTVVFFQVPNAVHILREVAFWDIYYEHCSYFTPGSLGRLFRRCGFDVLRLRTAYEGQYLLIEARPSAGIPSPPHPEEDDLAQLARDVRCFSASYRPTVDAWRRYLQESQGGGQRVVLWGGSSKAVAFLTTLGTGDEIEYVVDINPYKQGTYMPGTGHMIVEPKFLCQNGPDVVIVMNPVYGEEITADLHRMGLTPQVLTVNRHG
jgi:hypothetical protein